MTHGHDMAGWNDRARSPDASGPGVAGPVASVPAASAIGGIDAGPQPGRIDMRAGIGFGREDFGLPSAPGAGLNLPPRYYRRILPGYWLLALVAGAAAWVLFLGLA